MFTAGSYTGFFRDALAARLRGAGSLLDIGCGNGGQIVAFSDVAPNCAFSGLDIAPDSIAAARQLYPSGAFEVADVATWERGGAYGAVFSHSVLHVCGAEPERFFRQAAGHVAPGGLLAISAPVSCWRNRAIMALRSALKIAPPLSRALALCVARLLGHSEAFISERMVYLTHTHRSHLRPDWAERIARKCGLRLVDWIKVPPTSWFQEQHILAVFERVSERGERQ